MRAGAAEAEYRPLLFSIAYGMTGSVGDAEDIVQDAFLGLTRARQAGTAIADPKAYLTTAVTRLGINYLRSARVRRETYVGDWLPEPVVVPADGPGPAEHAELADSLSMAFLVLLEALSPVERAVFMLREVFGYGYPAVARITGKTEVNCRQIFARARQRIAAGGQARQRAAPARRAEGGELARRFFEAADGGDMDALLAMLAPDVVFQGDGGGKAQAIGQPLHGRQRVPGCSAACSAGAGPWALPSGWPGSTASQARSRTTRRGAWSTCSRSTSPTAWCRRSVPWSIPTSLATSGRCPTSHGCRRGNYRSWVWTGAPCQDCSWWVSPARPPHPACDSHRTGRSTCLARWG